jgi:peptide/nickel transport system permease protein
VLIALGADLLASELPLAARVDGRTWWLPCLTHPAALVGQSTASLRPRAEWLWQTPVPFGPNQTLATSGDVRAGPPPWAPDARHLLGTDELGRDVLARVLHGARVSLLIALGAVLLASVVGVLLGGLAGARGGWVDLLLSRLMELMTTFPTVFFLIALFAVLRTQSLAALVIVLGLTRWPELARLTRAEVLRVRGLDFVLVARAQGLSGARILFRHLLPNALGPVLVAATFNVAATLLLESGLSFLGLGVAPPTASWGELLTQAHRNLVHPGAWWLAVFPGAALASVVLCVNAVGEMMARRFDVRR